MNNSFTIERAQLDAGNSEALKTELLSAAGSESDAASILRSLERLGNDPSILFYEVTRVTGKRTHSGAATNAWRVRADRGAPEPEPAAT